MKHKTTIDWTKVESPTTFNIKELTQWAIEQMLKQDINITVENMSTELGVSTRTCFRLLKQNKYAFAKQKQIENAKQLLEMYGYEVRGAYNFKEISLCMSK